MTRLSPIILALALLATACSSELVDEIAGVADDSTEAEVVEESSGNTTAPTVAEAQDVEEPIVVEGPTTTLVPPLEGPFSTDGGAFTADIDQASLIIEEDPDRAAVANLTFPTDWTRRTIDGYDELLSGLGGNDPRDGIPPIDTPIFESPALASEWLAPSEPGALVQFNGEARFYPLSILTRHEIVNDAFGDIPIAVTYCPLCNTAIAFDRRIDGEVIRLGVSGLLRNSDLVMWDDATTSLWQQVTGEAIAGEFAGLKLESVPTSIVSFRQFAENFPEGGSLAGESARGRSEYGANPYVGYSSSQRPFLFDGTLDGRLPALSRVVGVSDGDTSAAYSFAQAVSLGVINDEVDGRPIVVLAGGDTNDALDSGLISGSQPIGTAIAHDPVVDGQTLTFTANGDETFTDEQTGSTWNVLGRATDGELAGTRLAPITHQNEFWFAWQAFFGADTLREL